MKLNKLFLMMMVTILSIGFVVAACGDDDDDDDDNDDASGDDDDNGGTGDPVDECIGWYEDCIGDTTGAETACSPWEQYADTGNECINTAVSEFFSCLSANADCTDSTSAYSAFQECYSTFIDVIFDC